MDYSIEVENAVVKVFLCRNEQTGGEIEGFLGQSGAVVNGIVNLIVCVK